MPRPGWYNDNVNRVFPLLNMTAGVSLFGDIESAQNSPIEIHSTDHGLTDGDKVIITEVKSTTGSETAEDYVNATWTIYNATANYFTLADSSSSYTYMPNTGQWESSFSSAIKNLPDYYIVDCGFTLGGSATFDTTAGEYVIYLKRISRAGSTVTFEFRCTDPVIHDRFPLTFTREIGTDTEYDLEYQDSDSPDDPGSTSESVPTNCRLPFWSGYLVTGDMSLIDDHLMDGLSITAPDWSEGDQQGVVEPSLVQNLARTVVSGINIANDDRTRATPPGYTPQGYIDCSVSEPPDCAGFCPDYVWDFEPDLTYSMERCITDDVRFKPGYNMSIVSEAGTNTITFRTTVNAGEGAPCNHETKLFPTDSGPEPAGNTWNNNLLEGGPTCNEVARTINGLSGPLVQFVGGQGVSIIPDPAKNKVTIDINLTDLDLCQYSTFSIG